MRTSEMVSQVKAGRVQSVLPMIAQHARATWHKLPDSEKTVRSLQDLIQEGINYTVTYVAKEFRLSYGVKFSSYLYNGLDFFYADVIRAAYADKRLIPHGMLSADSTRVNVGGKNISLLDKIKLTRKTRFDQELRIINRIDAERMFVKVYANASPILRRYMIKWLLQPKVSRNKKGTEFNNAKKEFRIVARPLLTDELCDTIQNDYMCRSNIASKVANTFHTPKKSSRSGFYNLEEFQVAPILSPEQFIQACPMIH